MPAGSGIRYLMRCRYQMMAEKSIASKLLLFHARFAMGDRLEREREVLTQFGTQSRDEDRREFF